MSFTTEFADVADAEVEAIYLWIMERSPDQAEKWREGLEQAVASLEFMPTRCKLAPDSSRYRAEVRQLLYGAYRILFTLVDANGDGENDTIRILHVRHGAQRRLNEQVEPGEE